MITIQKPNDNPLKIKYSFLQHHIISIKFYSKMFQHFIHNYPIFIEQINTFKNEIVNQETKLFNNNNYIKCFRLYKGYNDCMKELLGDFEIKKFEEKINTYISRNSMNTIFYMKFQNSNCLPKNMKWEHEGEIQIIMVGENFYVDNNLGLDCVKKWRFYFNCYDNVNNFTFVIPEDDLYDEILLVCENNNFYPYVNYYREVQIKREKNIFLEDLLDNSW